jgi:uncharacterized protein YaaN involved in tellurite resistance
MFADKAPNKPMELNELLNQIKTTIQQNNIGLTDNRLSDLNQSCDNITNSLNSIDQVLDNLKKLTSGIEVAPEDLANSLRELNLTELTGESLKNKFEQILNLAANSNQELTDKIKDTERELEAILNTLQHQQTLITNYQDQITTLETKVKGNENQVKELQIKAGLIGSGITAFLGGLLIMLARYLRNRAS